MVDSISQHIEKLIAEGPVGMAECGRMLGTFRDGKPCHSSTPTRWCLSGVRLPDGHILRLEHYRTAGRLMTSRAALIRFLKLHWQEPIDLPDVSPRSPAARRRAADRAADELTAAGV